jgi:CHAT domain-containing protein
MPGATVEREGAATTESVERAMGDAVLIHLACHGRYLREVPGASGLKLADGWLTLDRIARTRLRGAHVTLSACETGRASQEAGDELIGLTRAFYSAGARSLIVSMWAIHDESAAVVMERLYRHVVDGSSMGSALRSAQVSAIDDGEHPARWAAFVYGGR